MAFECWKFSLERENCLPAGTSDPAWANFLWAFCGRCVPRSTQCGYTEGKALLGRPFFGPVVDSRSLWPPFIITGWHGLPLSRRPRDSLRKTLHFLIILLYCRSTRVPVCASRRLCQPQWCERKPIAKQLVESRAKRLISGAGVGQWVGRGCRRFSRATPPTNEAASGAEFAPIILESLLNAPGLPSLVGRFDLRTRRAETNGSIFFCNL